MYTVQCASNNNEHECCKLFEYASSLIQFLYLLYLHVLHRHTPHCLALRALHDLVKSGNHILFAPPSHTTQNDWSKSSTLPGGTTPSAYPSVFANSLRLTCTVLLHFHDYLVVPSFGCTQRCNWDLVCR